MLNYARKRKYIVLSLAIFLFSSTLLYAFFSNFQENMRLKVEFQENLQWTISQGEPDLLRFLGALQSFSSGDVAVSHDEVVTRFNILWSRIELFLKGPLGEEYKKVTGVHATAVKAMDILGRTEARVMSLKRQKNDKYQEIYSAYQGLARKLHTSILNVNFYTNQKTLDQRNHTRDLLKRSAILFTAVLLSGGFLIFLLIREIGVSNKLLLTSEQAKEELGHQKERLQELVDTRTAALRAAKEEAEAADKTKSLFLAGMSHELRTPLNAIIGFSDMMRMKTFGPLGDAHYEKYSDDIHSSGSLILSLINDILDLSKIEAGKYELAEEPLNISTLIEASVRQLKKMAEKNNQTLSPHVPSDIPALMGDERAMIQIFNNLLSNAIKFSHEGGEIIIDARVDESNSMIVRVADTGIGMSGEGIAKALEPFVQAVAFHSRRSRQGTGLGLYLCTNLMKLLGGTMVIESEVGKGTTVILRFPPERTIPPI